MSDDLEVLKQVDAARTELADQLTRVTAQLTQVRAELETRERQLAALDQVLGQLPNSGLFGADHLQTRDLRLSHLHTHFQADCYFSNGGPQERIYFPRECAPGEYRVLVILLRLR